ncbi:hypothetical protein C8Q80DRAFT_1351339 [Daedaleopsis nitida]|nr:hypothetical protein C8Q80DRAFT_1351339 [Daedaleopsis nitida]
MVLVLTVDMLGCSSPILYLLDRTPCRLRSLHEANTSIAWTGSSTTRRQPPTARAATVAIQATVATPAIRATVTTLARTAMSQTQMATVRTRPTPARTQTATPVTVRMARRPRSPVSRAASTEQTSSPYSSNSSNSTPVGAIAGGTAAGVVLFIGIAVLAFWIDRSRRRRRKRMDLTREEADPQL